MKMSDRMKERTKKNAKNNNNNSSSIKKTKKFELDVRLHLKVHRVCFMHHNNISFEHCFFVSPRCCCCFLVHFRMLQCHQIICVSSYLSAAAVGATVAAAADVVGLLHMASFLCCAESRIG